MARGLHKHHGFCLIAAITLAILAAAPATDCREDEFLLLLVMTEADDDQAAILKGTLQAHLNGLGVHVDTVRKNVPIAHVPTESILAARARKAQIAVWASGNLTYAGVAFIFAGTPSVNIDLPEDNRTFKARCALIATKVLAFVEPRIRKTPVPTLPRKRLEAPPKPSVSKPPVSKPSSSVPPSKTPPFDPPISHSHAPFSTWRFCISGNAALVIPTSKLSVGPGGEFAISLLPPPGNGGWMLEGGGTISKSKIEGVGSSPLVGEFTYTNEVLLLSTYFQVSFRPFTLENTFSPFLGVGPAFQLAKTTQSNSLGNDPTESTWEPGLTVCAGTDFLIGPGYVFAQVRWIHTDLDQGLTGDTNGGLIAVQIGYRFVFPPLEAK